MSLNKNVLQQKTYIIVSYFASEFGSVSTYSREEIDSICFSELFTRTQSVIRSLAAAEVGGKILDSEGLAELLYIAYNRDDSELMQLGKALDAQYDALYSTSKDVLIKKQEKLEEELNEKSVETKNVVKGKKQKEDKTEENEDEKTTRTRKTTKAKQPTESETVKRGRKKLNTEKIAQYNTKEGIDKIWQISQKSEMQC